MHRAVALAVWACPRWGGRLRLIATVHDADVVRAILAHRGLAPAPDPPGPAPPQPDHAAATGSPPPGGQAGLSRSAQSVLLDRRRLPPGQPSAPLPRPLPTPCPGRRIAAGAGSEPGGLGSREGSGAGGSTTLGFFRAFWIPAAWGGVM